MELRYDVESDGAFSPSFKGPDNDLGRIFSLTAAMVLFEDSVASFGASEVFSLPPSQVGKPHEEEREGLSERFACSSMSCLR